MPRLLIANLDCEQEYANPAAPRKLPAAVRRRISAVGSLLAVFARPGDTLWTPEPIDPARVALEPAAHLTFASGQLPERAPDALLCWAQTPTTARLRPPAAPRSAADPRDRRDWPAALWQVHADAAAARRCNDRRYGFRLGQALGAALPGAAILASVDELARHLAAGNHASGHDGTWVLEAPFSASGRLRLRRKGPALDRAARTRAERLFRTFGELIFQPWVDRVLDFGCVGVIHGADRWHILAPHWLDNDAAGVFRGICAGAPGAWPCPLEVAGGLAQEVAQTAAATMDAVARALAGDGYRGPFGIDGFAFRDARGVHIHPMCEINARLSFGFVAHALALAHPGTTVHVRLGNGPVPAWPGRIVPLLHPGHDDDTSAWLRLDPAC